MKWSELTSSASSSHADLSPMPCLALLSIQSATLAMRSANLALMMYAWVPHGVVDGATTEGMIRWYQKGFLCWQHGPNTSKGVSDNARAFAEDNL